MAQPIAVRRAAAYRQRALQLTETAAHLRDEGNRKHLLDLVATYRRAADQHGRTWYFKFFAFVAGGEIIIFIRLRE